MIIRKKLAVFNYSKIDSKIWTNRDISDGAVRLYGYLASLRNGQNYVDKYIIKALGISQKTLTNRKKELKDAGLILIEQIDKRVYVLYVGSSACSAQEVKEHWDRLEEIEE